MTTYFAHPGDSQCRLYRCDVLPAGALAARHYRSFPELWTEAGHVNYYGTLVSFDGPRAHADQLRECEPIGGGVTVRIQE